MDQFTKILSKEPLSILLHIHKKFRNFEKAISPQDLASEAQFHGLLELTNLFIQQYSVDYNNLTPSYERLKQTPSIPNISHFLALIERQLHLNNVKTEFDVTTIDQLTKSRTTFPLSIILHNVRSAHNIGSIFRSCEGLGVKKLYLTGYTSTPENPRLATTALGADKHIPWDHTDDVLKKINQLQKQNILVAAFETSEQAIVYEGHRIPSEEAVFVFGNERYGLEPEVLQAADRIYKVPMWGRKNSLNVSNTVSLVCALKREKHKK
ncbi:MAG: hypothetical protein HOO06_10705 [Bdellovibrionaceae bacterium]|jgi:23S rRNA (guanosine2251-2'-O)-methyltransferase|nr:hypothetical protein [Pseudobdellovibrionaceae bacterium]